MMKGLNKTEEAILRAIADRHGYVAGSGPHTGKGSASALLTSILSGELATVLLGDEERRWFIQWLEAQLVADELYADVPRLVAEQLRAAARRDDST